MRWFTKAPPKRTWEDGFQAGYQQAYQKLPALHQQVQETIRTQAIEETLARLEPVIAKRVEEVKKANLQSIQSLLQKREQFLRKSLSVTNPTEKQKYVNYLEALDWMLHAPDSVHSNESLSQ